MYEVVLRAALANDDHG